MKCIEDEIPFDIPDGWVWCRLVNVTSKIIDGSHNPPKASKKRTDYIMASSKNINNDNLCNLDDVRYISKEEYEKENARTQVTINDILLTAVATLGRSCVFMGNIKNLTFQRSVSIITTFMKPEYLKYYFDASYFQKHIENNSTGNAQKGFYLNQLEKVLVCMPPFSEQQRIADCIERYNAIIGTLETDIKSVKDTISVVKSKILDLAIHGKLVPQNPDDEPAAVLLDRIRAEKEELIKSGKIKRDKKESVIFKGEDNSYYQNVPNNWSIASLSEITTSQLLNDGDWILSDNMDSAGEVKLIQLGSVGFLEYIDKGFKYLTNEMFEYLNCTEIHSGYMLINRIVSDKMTVCILPEIIGKKITTVDTCWVAPKENWYNLKFILYSLASTQYQSSVLFYSSGTTRKRISKTNLIALPLAIPPLAEQKRIVKAIETIFAQLDEISNAIT